MKKRILFVMCDLTCGGAEKSLVTLLNCIDYSKYEVDLLLFEPMGIFIDMLPPQVKLLEGIKYLNILSGSARKSILYFLKERRLDLVFSSIMKILLCRKYTASERVEQKLWKYYKPAISPINNNYDVAIGYMEKTPIYFIADKVKAKKKIGWIHISYETLMHDCGFEDKYLSKIDHIVTVSLQCANTLKKFFPDQSKKINVIENIVQPSMLNKMALISPVERDHRKLCIVTVARLENQKGIDLALEAAHMLNKAGYQFVWSIFGDGTQRVALENKIRQYGLEEVFLLEGIKANPYPYIHSADIYVQPSRYEGKSIAIEEAKILKKPIIVTSFSSVKDQIQNEVNGIIVDISPEGICQGIKKLIDNPELKMRLSNNLDNENLGNENEINKLYKLIEG